MVFTKPVVAKSPTRSHSHNLIQKGVVTNPPLWTGVVPAHLKQVRQVRKVFLLLDSGP